MTDFPEFIKNSYILQFIILSAVVGVLTIPIKITLDKHISGNWRDTIMSWVPVLLGALGVILVKYFWEGLDLGMRICLGLLAGGVSSIIVWQIKAFIRKVFGKYSGETKEEKEPENGKS